jgi:hypothetical protein
MGMTYLMTNEFELAMDFLKEGLSTLIDEDASSHEIAVSCAMKLCLSQHQCHAQFV